VFLAERYCSRKDEEYEVVKLKDVRNRRMSCSKDELVGHNKLTCWFQVTTERYVRTCFTAGVNWAL
jgi:hypothetical protein